MATRERAMSTSFVEELLVQLGDPARASQTAEMLRETNLLAWLSTNPEFGRFVRECAATGRADVLERAALASPGCLDLADDSGRTSLHFAARRGHLVTLNRLLDFGANVRLATHNGNTALHIVAKYSVVPQKRKYNVAQYLEMLKSRAAAAAQYVQAHLAPSSTDTTGDDVVVAESDLDTVDEVEEETTATPTRSWGGSMLHLPVAGKPASPTASAEHLQPQSEKEKEKEVAMLQQLDSEGALAQAVPKIDELISFTVKRLCNVLGASVPNAAGWTPLRLAIDRSNDPVARFLRECGAQLGDEPHQDGAVDIVDVAPSPVQAQLQAIAAAVQETEPAKALSAASAKLAHFAQSVAESSQTVAAAVRRFRIDAKTAFIEQVRGIIDSEPRKRPFSRLPTPFVLKPSGKYRILSMDGGGVRCVMHCVLLSRISKRFPTFLENTEMFAGCSGGAPLTVWLQSGLSIEQVSRLVVLSAESTLRKAAGNGLTGVRYTSKWLRMLCDLVMGELRLKDLPRHVVIPAYKLDNGLDGFARKGESLIITNAVPGSGSEEEKAVDACLRSGSAPTYFNAYQGFVDGGIFANNPSHAALPIVLGSHPRLQIPVDKVVCLSLGTGRCTSERFVDRSKVINGGLAQWGLSLMDVLDAAQLDFAEQNGRSLLGDRFFRNTPELPGLIRLDDVTNIPLLVELAEKMNLDSLFAWIEHNWF